MAIKFRGFELRRRSRFAGGACTIGLILSIWSTARAESPDKRPASQPTPHVASSPSSPDDAVGWLKGLPAPSVVESIYAGTDVASYARSAAAFAVLIDFVEVRSGVNQRLMGATLVAELPPPARALWRLYVGHGYSKTLTGVSWQLFTTPAFRKEVLSRFVSPASLALYETARNRIPGVAGPSAQPDAPSNTTAPSPPPVRAAAEDEVSSDSADPVAPSWRIQFASGSSSLKNGPQAQQSLRELSLFLAQHREIARLRIEGHASNLGTSESSLALSRRRALAIRDDLIQLGVEGERLVVVPFGALKPIADNATAAGRVQNERVDLRIAALRASAPITASANPTNSAAGEGRASPTTVASSTDGTPSTEGDGAKSGAVDKYGGHVGSDGFYYDRFGGHYDQFGYEYKDGSYKSRSGVRFDWKSNKVFDADGSEIVVSPDIKSRDEKRSFVKVLYQVGEIEEKQGK